jgi:protein SCO1/2
MAGRQRQVTWYHGWFLVPVLLAITLAAAACGQPYQFKGTQYPTGKLAADFELVTAQGQPFRLSDQQGHVVMLFFGYTSCPDICPTTLSEARRVLEDLGEDGTDVRYAFVTVDPERDTPDKLASYTASFHPAIIGLTGDPATLAAVQEDYGVVAERQELEGSAIGYIINHTARVFLIDQQGNLRLSYAFGTPTTDMVADLRQVLKTAGQG